MQVAPVPADRLRLSEAELDRLAVIYQANPILRRAGVSYGDFIAAPDRLIAALLTPPPVDDDPRPLLPAQERIRRRLERAELLAEAARRHTVSRTTNAAQVAEAALPGTTCRRGTGYVEPLRHHAWAVSLDRRPPR